MEKERKSKKKIGAIVLMVVLIIILLLCLVQCQSCSGDADPTGNTTATGEPTTEGTGNSEPSTETTTSGEDLTEPSGEATDPSTAPSEPSTEITEPSTDATDPSGHIHSYTETKTAPGCETEGYTTYTCACGDTFTGDKVVATGHQWGEWVTTQEPTENATGTAERVCANCAKAETRTLDKVIPQHTHKYTGKVTKAATCSAEGVKTYTCSCGSTYTEAIAKTAHSYKSTVTAPTCTAKGYTTYKCSACGDSYKADYTNAKGHSYSSKVTKEATCTAEGTKTFTCSCGSSYTEKIAKVAHKYVDSVTAPTCTEDGYTTHTCSACGNSYTDSKVSATGHSYTSKVTTEATCEKDGVKTYTCSKCFHSYTEAIKHGHNWKRDFVVSNLPDYYPESWARKMTVLKCWCALTAMEWQLEDYGCETLEELFYVLHDVQFGNAYNPEAHTFEVGYWETELVCGCGWACSYEDVVNAGCTSRDSWLGNSLDYWELVHVKQYEWTADERYHSNYSYRDEWVVDESPDVCYVCTECGKETATKP